MADHPFATLGGRSFGLTPLLVARLSALVVSTEDLGDGSLFEHGRGAVVEDLVVDDHAFAAPELAPRTTARSGSTSVAPTPVARASRAVYELAAVTRYTDGPAIVLAFHTWTAILSPGFTRQYAVTSTPPPTITW